MSSKTQLVGRRLVLLGGLGLAGCGFRPVFGTNGIGNTLLGKTKFQTSETVFGFRTRVALEDRFGLPATESFVVEISLSETPATAAINAEGDTTRFDLRGSANWLLKTSEGSVMAQGDVETSTSYSATGSTVATQAAELDARERLAIAVADLIAADLIIAVAGSTR